MDREQLAPADRIVRTMQRIYAYGMTTTSGGNLSVREDGGDLWITPSGVDKGALTPEDVVLVRPDGRVVGRHRPSVELPFHQQIYARRPDLRALVHAHPPALVAFSLSRRVPETLLVPGVRQICGDVGLAPYGLPGSAALGEQIAGVFGRGCDAALLENHGVVTGGRDLGAAYMAFETLDCCARIEIQARRVGTPRPLAPEALARADRGGEGPLPELTPGPVSGEEREARRALCALLRRGCDQRLFTSTQGTFSCRLDDGAFVITPHGLDRRTLEPEDLVRVEGGRREAGKRPSRSVALHQRVYARHPGVRAVLLARPPHITAFAVTGERFDTRTIPECYIMLRDVPRLPFGTPLLAPDRAAATLGEAAPLALVENDGVIAVGATPLQAFDRLEVAEYSARALVACRALGDVVMIDDGQVADIVRAFDLG